MPRLHRPCAWSIGALCLATVGLCAQRDLIERLPPEQDAHALPVPAFHGDWAPVEMPGSGAITGLAALGDRLWVLRGAELHAFDWPGTFAAVVTPPEGVLGLATDGEGLCALRARAIDVLDAATGAVVRTVSLGPAAPADAVAMHGDQVCVQSGTKSFVVLLRTKEVHQDGTGSIVAPTRHWAVRGGARLWSATAREGDRGAKPRWDAMGRWPLPERATKQSLIDGVWLVHARAREGGEDVAWVGLAPKLVPLPATRLRLHVSATVAGPRYQLGPKQLRNLAGLAAELARIAGDPSAQVQWPTGAKRLAPVVIEAGPGAVVADVVRVWEAVTKAGFADVTCPVLEAWARTQLPVVADGPSGDGGR
jgi:hypothetical protein